MIKIGKGKKGEISKELLDTHQEWFELYFDRKITSLEDKNTFKMKSENIDIDKSFLEEVKKWKIKSEKLAVSKKLIVITKGFKEEFEELDKYIIEQEIKSKLLNNRKELERIRDDYNEKSDFVSERKKKVDEIKSKMKEEVEKLENLNIKIEIKEESKTLIEFIEDINVTSSQVRNFNPDNLKSYFKKDKGMEDKIKLLKYLFDYNAFSKLEEYESKVTGKKVKWGRHEFLTKLGIAVCPYCNRQYINNYKEEDLNRTTADLDHFYIKSLYPYLALSIYNFIPSCQICNRTFKGAIDFFDGEENNHLYPYDDEFGDDVKFTLDLAGDYDVDVLLGMSENFEIDIEIKDKLEHKTQDKEKIKKLDDKYDKKKDMVDKSIKTFKLKKVYSQNHKDYVKELIRKAIIYNDSRINEIYSQYGELFNNKEEVINMIVGNYIGVEEIGKRPLGILTRDICNELGIK